MQGSGTFSTKVVFCCVYLATMSNSKNKIMKRQLYAETAVAVLMTASCQKDDAVPSPSAQGSNSSQTGLRTQQHNPDLPTGRTTPLAEMPDLRDAVYADPGFSDALSSGSLDAESGMVVHYGVEGRMAVLFKSPSVPGRHYCWVMSGTDIVSSCIADIAGTDAYLASMPGGVSFADPSVPFAGSLQLSRLDGSSLGGVDIDFGAGVLKPHGGFGSWSDCVEHYGSQWWAIIGGILCPEGILIGLAVGCL